MSDLDIATRASSDSPERIRAWPKIRHFLRKRFGDNLSDTELWERCIDWLQAERKLLAEKYLRMPDTELLSLLEEAVNAAQAPQDQVVVIESKRATLPPPSGRFRQEIYENLLCEFRREHASSRRGSILLQLVREKDFKLQKELLPKEILFCDAKVLEQKLASVDEPCNLYCEGFRVVCVPYTSEVLQNSERSQFDRDVRTAWEAFSDLATRAGAHLNKTFREVMPGAGEKPLANWLQLMFCNLRPQIDLESAYGDCCNFSHIPFSDAANVNEQCKLATNDPILPPLLQERKERADAIPEASVQPKGEKTKNSAKKVRKRGRRSDTDHDEDKQIFDAWQTGRHETKALCDAGYMVAALVRRLGKAELPVPSVRPVLGDLSDPASLARAVEDVDAVVHVAGFVSTATRDRRRLVEVNVDGGRNLLETVRSPNVQRVVFTSSTSAVEALFDDRPGDALCEDADFNLRELQSPYVQVKREAHEAALQAWQEGLPLVVLSPTLALGSGAQRFTSMELIDTFVNDRMPGYLDGGLSAVDVRDVACDYVATLEHPAPASHYILAGSENLPMQQFFQRLARASGLKAPRWRIRRTTALAAAAVVQLFAPWSSFSPASVRMGTLYWYFDSSSARRDLQFRPRPLDETLSVAVQWVRTRRGTGSPTSFGEAS